MPAQRRIARSARGIALGECAALLGGDYHEERFTALAILRERFDRAGAAERERIADLYLDRRAGVDNWDLVDSSAPYLLAERARADPGLLDRLARSERLWDRRIAILASFAFIREGDLDPTFELSLALLRDHHDLIHKAVGWMLREAGKRDPARLREFLADNAGRMPRTALRYAIERLERDEREHWMSRPRTIG